MTGMLSCASGSCHGSSQPQRGAIRRQEYARWLEFDPHARSAETINSPRFREILIGASHRPDGQADPQVYLSCAKCHDPQGLALAGNDPHRLVDTLADAGTRGISCESCHGPAEQWLTRHFDRRTSREELDSLGMLDTENLLVRGRVCASCHVGDAERNMNHDMIAAGHPPLRFELSSYHDLIRQKHWTDSERIETPEFKVQLWAAGQLAVADSTLSLLKSRAGGHPEQPWPEFSEYECFACHQRMRPQLPAPGTAERPMQVRKSGLPEWQVWNLSMAEKLLSSGTTTRNDPHAQFQSSLSEIRKTFSGSLTPDHEHIVIHANRATTALHGHPLGRELADRRYGSSGSLTTQQLLRLISAHNDPGQASWAASCQDWLALRSAYLAWRDEVHKLQLMGRLSSNEHAGLTRGDWALQFEAQLAMVRQSLEFGSREFEWPRYDWQGLPMPDPLPLPQLPLLTSLDAVDHQLKGIATQLLIRMDAGSDTSASGISQ